MESVYRYATKVRGLPLLDNVDNCLHGALGRTALEPVPKASIHSGLVGESRQAQGNATAIAGGVAASRQRGRPASRHAGA